jgi:predicted TIM-barrel fold metal-dependent hydrolase
MYASDYPHESWTAMIEELDEFTERPDLSDDLKTNTLSVAAQRFYHLDEEGKRTGPRAPTRGN